MATDAIYASLREDAREARDSYARKRRGDGMMPLTIQKDSNYLTTVLKFLNKNPHEITIDDVENWKQEMVKRNFEPETRWQQIHIFQKFLEFLGKKDIADKIKLPKRPSRVPPEKEIWLLPEEQHLMVAKSKEMGVRAYAIIKLFLSSGIRVGEMVKLDISDVDFDNKTIQIRHGKGDKSRVICIDGEAKDAIFEYLKTRAKPKNQSTALFLGEKTTERLGTSGISSIVKECTVRAGICKRISPHKLRHTFITNVIEKTKDIPLAQQLAGHADIKTTMRYHHQTHEQTVAKYREYFDKPPESEPSQTMTNEELLRALDAKFIKGEVTYEVYNQLRSRYMPETDDLSKKGKIGHDLDVAYR